MNALRLIIKEEILRFIGESYGYDDAYEYFSEREYELKDEIFNDFLYNNNSDFTKHIPWTVIPFSLLKSIWEYAAYHHGIVRNEKGFERIRGIMINNIIKVNIITYLSGHTPENFDNDFEENIGYFVDQQLNCVFKSPENDINQLEIPFDNPKAGYKKKKPNENPCQTTVHPFVQEFIDNNYDDEMSRDEIRKLLNEEITDRFYWYYFNDPKGELGGFMSDYGLKPLLELLHQLLRTDKPEQELPIIDRMLNVVHMRSDIAKWFVEGGSNSLSQLSASPSEINQPAASSD